MNNIEAIKQDLQAKFPESNFEYNFINGNNVVDISSDQLIPVLEHLKSSGQYDVLMNQSAVDFPDSTERFQLFYELFSTKDIKRLRIRTKIKENEAIDSATPVWKAANWFERETYDMFGIEFKNHPNLTRILCHHEFKGWPLRKDYDADHQQHCNTTMPIHFQDEYNYVPDPNKNLIP